MKRALIIAACAVLALTVAGRLAWPRIVTVVTERIAAKNRQTNNIPDSALHALAWLQR